MAQAVSRLTLTRRLGFEPWSVIVGFLVENIAMGQTLVVGTSVFPHQYHSIGVPNH
jgi:hypothetical protein